IMEKGDQLLQLITGILDVSRIETGAMKVVREPVELEDLIAGAVAAMTPMARRKRLELRGAVDPRRGHSVRPPRVLGDRDKIRRVVVTLVGSAFKSTPEGGKIEIQIDVGPLIRDEELGVLGDLTGGLAPRASQVLGAPPTALGSSPPPQVVLGGVAVG